MKSDSTQSRSRGIALPIKRRSVWSSALCAAVLIGGSKAATPCDSASMKLFVQFGPIGDHYQPDHVAFELGSGIDVKTLTALTPTVEDANGVATACLYSYTAITWTLEKKNWWNDHT